MPDVPQSQATHFGKYLLDREMARGGMSRVYRARLRGPGGFEKKLVVKQILPELARDPSFIELFVKEANTLVQMSHPGLVPVYELGVIDGVYFLAMERVDGATISEMLRDGPLPEALVAQIGLEIAEALRYAHERFQIVHRDVTTRNVIVDDAGHARLLDFGIAAPVELTGTGELFGSPGYMAPEQLRGEALGAESDLFALGAVLHEAATGTPALPRVTSSAALPYPDVPLADAVHPVLQTSLARMLKQARSERPSSAAEVATALRTWLAEHHPGGVERQLAVRARKAHDAREAAPPMENAGSTAATTRDDGPKSGPVEVRSIATSPVLDELLKQATERIERAPAENAAPLATSEPDPEAQATIRRFIRDIVAITFALAIATYWARHYPLRHDTPEDLEPPASALVPANAPMPAAAQAPAVTPTTVTAPAPAAVPTPSAAVPAEPSAAAGVIDTTTAAAPVEPGTEATKSAQLTVNAVPWAEVSLDGRPLGVTPRRKLPLAAGKHTLTLECPPLGRTARVPLQARPGQTLQVLVDMQSEPPKIDVR